MSAKEATSINSHSQSTSQTLNDNFNIQLYIAHQLLLKGKTVEAEKAFREMMQQGSIEEAKQGIKGLVQVYAKSPSPSLLNEVKRYAIKDSALEDSALSALMMMMSIGKDEQGARGYLNQIKTKAAKKNGKTTSTQNLVPFQEVGLLLQFEHYDEAKTLLATLATQELSRQEKNMLDAFNRQVSFATLRNKWNNAALSNDADGSATAQLEDIATVSVPLVSPTEVASSLQVSAYPNPFNPTTTLSYTLPKETSVRFVIYDLTGREVAVLVNTTQTAGSYNASWDGTRFASGVYIYKLMAGEQTISGKLMLVK